MNFGQALRILLTSIRRLAGRLIPLRWLDYLRLAALLLATLAWLGVTMIFLGTPHPPRLADPQTLGLTPDAKAWLGHLLLFFGVGFLAAVTSSAGTNSRRVSLLLGTGTLSGFLWGAFTEWYQTKVPGRSGNLEDVITDTLGASLGSLAAWLLGRR